jgi:hypothetical protein
VPARTRPAQPARVPAQQRFGAARGAAPQVELRLVDERELLALERAPQLCSDLRARPRALGQLGGEEMVGIASGLLGAIHRRVGGAEQRLGVAAVD